MPLARIYYTISLPLSGAMEECSIVRVQQLQNALLPKVLYVRVTTHSYIVMYNALNCCHCRLCYQSV